MNNFINTAATDLARARTVALNQLTPEPFPVLVIGTKSTQAFFFANRGTIESWSGLGTYSLRLTIGDVVSQAIAGTFSLAVSGGPTLTIPYDIDAAGLQNILNSNATVGTTDGGVYVFDRGFGRYLIAYKALGAPTALTAASSLLAPDCAAELTTLTTGSPTVRQLMLLTLRRTVTRQTTSFSIVASPSAGWSGTVDLTSSAAYQMLWLKGVPRGQFLELQTLLTLEVIDPNGVSTPYYQTPVILRGLNYMDTTTLGVGPTRNAQTSSAAGTVAIAPASQIHTEIITFTGSANTRDLVIATTGLQAGAQVDVSCVFDGVADGVVINIYAVSTAGTLLANFTKAGGEPNALFTFVANGAGGFQPTENLVPAFYDPGA